ncbi:MAG: hypothetical protein A2932_00545 [Candidatus Spechtbacteria bacterium RIFCSPLOWO2_01_FULL_46_10]|uniref:Uncharacterized protein n=1 Tax=Candidatus Spechtbacteria bacterium RIFCSPLOWO2_01_FULL_46_10 TaxID=1802163 RepID=A0A1G2HG02_9BACT|nr:MAG: hypothetical protein A2932_00545 [Candidatus Spechtbacteria bacterium RIFCSPLOWO2_01_FULL_46_10]
MFWTRILLSFDITAVISNDKRIVFSPKTRNLTQAGLRVFSVASILTPALNKGLRLAKGGQNARSDVSA